MTETERSIKILETCATLFATENPDCEIPEEFTVDPILYTKSYICNDGSALSSEEIPKDTETFVVDTFDNSCHWKHLKVLSNSRAKQSIETLYLGHDGCIFGEKEDIEEVLTSLPNLKKVYACGYHAQYWDDLDILCSKYNIKTVPIY